MVQKIRAMNKNLYFRSVPSHKQYPGFFQKQFANRLFEGSLALKDAIEILRKLNSGESKRRNTTVFQ